MQTNNFEETVEGWVAVDVDSVGYRRVTVFAEKPAREYLAGGVHPYWAARVSPFSSMALSPESFSDLGWEDEPVKVEISIRRKNRFDKI